MNSSNAAIIKNSAKLAILHTVSSFELLKDNQTGALSCLVDACVEIQAAITTLKAVIVEGV